MTRIPPVLPPRVHYTVLSVANIRRGLVVCVKILLFLHSILKYDIYIYMENNEANAPIALSSVDIYLCILNF